MRANLVVIGPPVIGTATCLEDRHETVHVEELVADLTVERFNAALLRWLTGRDEVQLDILLGCPAQHGVARELRAVIKPNRLGQPAFEGDPFKLPDSVGASQRVVDVQRQALAGEVVDDGKGSNRAAVLNPIVHEIDRPTLVWSAYRLDEVAANIVDFPLAARPNLQLQGAIDPAKSRLSDLDLGAANHDQQSAPSPARPLRRQRLELRDDRLIVDRFTSIVQIAAVVADEIARANRRDAAFLERPHGFLFPR